MVKITSSNPRKIAYLKSVYVVPKSNLWNPIKFITFFNTPSACGGVKGGVIIRHYGIRQNLT
jgi:hypothetical protein